MKSRQTIDMEMKKRYGYAVGEHPDRAKIRLILETEPMARWLAEREIANAIDAAVLAELEGIRNG